MSYEAWRISYQDSEQAARAAYEECVRLRASSENKDDRQVRVLHLTLKRIWFDMIANGQKREEYREVKPYWTKRLAGKEFDVIRFRNGYAKDAPTMDVEFKSLGHGRGHKEWGGGGDPVYILALGAVLAHDAWRNCNGSKEAEAD